MENQFDELIKKYSDKFHLDWLLTKAQIKQESNFNPNAENKRTHAKGLMQFMDSTWKEWADLSPGIQDTYKNHNPFNPEDSISAGCAYMHWLINSYRLSSEGALRSYNWGVGNYLKWVKTPDKIQMPTETKEYSEKIFEYYNEYKKVQQ